MSSVKLIDVKERLGLLLLTPNVSDLLEREVSKAFVSDLLSNVLANAPRKGLLVTLQTHMNVVAVAVHCELYAVIFVQGRIAEETVVKKAEEEKIILFSTERSAFDVVGELYAMGITGDC
ncbi:MAG: serine kinase [Candidatus Hydrogenedentes bacterium]|nr:serine kinase [Candidatus Hydrogenedentota bacterium]